jgi:CDP-glucose 4,6-dehydratase
VGFGPRALEELVRFWQGKRVFLTGHTGFKGAWLALWLSRLGASTTGYALEPPSTPSFFDAARVAPTLDDLRADVRDGEGLARALRAARPEVVFHLAAQSLVRRSYAEPAATYATNVLGTVNVLEAVRRAAGVRAVVVVTSDKCYENLEQARGFRESDRLGGHDPYSSSKACAELVTQSFRDCFLEKNGTRVASVRAGNVVGGGDWAQDRLIPDLVRAACEGRAARVRRPEAVRPWQHVLDPLAGYLALAERLAEGAAFAEAWNFGPDESDARPVRWVVEEFCRRWGGGASWQGDEDDHPHEAGLLMLDAGKARERLAWRPAWDAAQAVARSVEWYKAHAAGADMRAFTLQQIADYERAVPRVAHA